MEEIKGKSKHPIRIELDALGRGSVKIGDILIPHARSVKFSAKADDLSVMEIEILCLDGVTIEAPADVLARVLDVRDLEEERAD